MNPDWQARYDLAIRAAQEAGRVALKYFPDIDSAAFADLRSQMGQTHVAAMQVAHAGHEDQIARAADALAEARRKIYLILAEEDRPGAEATDEPPRNV